jgi:hypothetical protein
MLKSAQLDTVGTHDVVIYTASHHPFAVKVFLSGLVARSGSTQATIQLKTAANQNDLADGADGRQKLEKESFSFQASAERWRFTPSSSSVMRPAFGRI